MKGYGRAGLAARAALVGWSDRGSLRAFRNDCVRRLVEHAYRRVPHYRELFDRHGVRPPDVQGVTDLRRLPITTRSQLQRRTLRERVADGVDADRLIENRTSGSSGAPLRIRRSWLEQNVAHLFRLREAHAQGVTARDRTVTVEEGRDTHPRDNKLIGRALNRLGLYRHDRVGVLLEPDEILARLIEARPEIIGGYPGVLNRVAATLGEAQRQRLRPRMVRTESEVLTPDMRRRIETGFGAPVRDTYATFEFNVIASECRDTGVMHVCDDAVVLEILRDGEPVGPGERGEVVATALHSYAMPFLRYRLGDLATRGSDRCACGAPYSTLVAIDGRMLDLFRLPDGRTLHPYAILSELLGLAADRIEQYQLLQERMDRIVLRVVPAAEATVDDLDRWAAVIRDAVGPRVEVDARRVDDIAPVASGKFRVAHSMVESHYPAAAVHASTPGEESP